MPVMLPSFSPYATNAYVGCCQDGKRTSTKNPPYKLAVRPVPLSTQSIYNSFQKEDKFECLDSNATGRVKKLCRSLQSETENKLPFHVFAEHGN